MRAGGGAAVRPARGGRDPHGDARGLRHAALHALRVRGRPQPDARGGGSGSSRPGRRRYRVVRHRLSRHRPGPGRGHDREPPQRAGVAPDARESARGARAHPRRLHRRMAGSRPGIPAGVGGPRAGVPFLALEPLSPWLARSIEVREPGYFPGIWDTNVIDGTLYGVPWYVDTRVLFYRRDLLARAGFESMPTTWEGWRAAMRAAKRAAGNDNFAVLLPVNEWPPLMIFGLH